MLDAAQIFRQSFQTSSYEAMNALASGMGTAATAAAQESGSIAGMSFVVEADPAQELQDSMEELSFQFEEKGVKSMAERKLGERKGVSREYLAAVQKWMNSVPDMPSQQAMSLLIKQLRTNMNSDGEPMSPAHLLSLMRKHTGDPTHLFAMLDLLEKLLGQDESALKAVVGRARDVLMNESGDEVKVGINLAEIVKAEAKSKEEMGQLRDLYRKEVLGFTNPADCFRSLLASRGEGRLAESIEFLFKGCSVELQANDPSRSPEELRRIINDLQSVEVLRTMLDKLNGMVDKMLSSFGERSLLSGEQLIGRFLDMIDMPFVNAANFGSLVSSAGIAQLLAQIYFMTEVTKRIRELSPRLFEKESDRFKLGDAAQEHLDGLVSLEEEAEERKKEGAAA